MYHLTLPNFVIKKWRLMLILLELKRFDHPLSEGCFFVEKENEVNLIFA